MPLKLTGLSFKASPQSPLSIAPVTLLVGPNNSGKSLTLREIEAWAKGEDKEYKIVDTIEVEWPHTVVEARELLHPFEVQPTTAEGFQPDSFMVSKTRLDGQNARTWISLNNLETFLPQRPAHQWVRQHLLGPFVARLDGKTRFDLVTSRPWQDLKTAPEHHLAALFFDDQGRQRVRDLVSTAFPGRYFVIDPTAMDRFSARISDREPVDASEERNWDARSIEFHKSASPIDDLSDGLICFAGLVSAVVSLPQKILLVDEPEAFLHPPLARQLGSALSELALERDTRLVAATHSAEFLIGCLESGVETSIVRLTFEGDAEIRHLAPDEIEPLIRDPLLRSTRALSALFHRGAIVCESDHDRALYSELNRRLPQGRSARDVQFTNAQNWSTTARIIGPLRKLGVPAAAILDLDALNGKKGEWKKILCGCGT